ncbi:MAG: alpha/beta fold hydrolase [Chloroflexi bacterium]|nr:MAG: alpha/beta fold hydrolase [Chloroflexota bacterium]
MNATHLPATGATYRVPGLVLTDHWFDLPLDHAQPAGPTISVYGREVVAPQKQNDALPWLLFLQGGPGFGAPRPLSASGWLKRAMQEFRIFLLDQRGTGRSTPVNRQTLAALGSARQQADYLKHFRADSIVQDAEWIRRRLVGANEPWSVLGQSYGGFCTVHYLSAAPEGVREVFITGGLPPLMATADEVYRATYRRVLEQNGLYYRRYPRDVEVVRRVVDALTAREVLLPSGDLLTPRRLQQLGLAFGASDGREQVHYLFEQAFVQGRHGPELGYPFLHAVEAMQSFNTNPIFAILHESIYCQQKASNWAAHRIRNEYPAFDSAQAGPVYFTGEMIYPWMFDEYGELQPLQEAADLLASDASWPRLYDGERLAQNQVPGAAAVYYDDMYVERSFSEETARAIPNLRMWITNEYEHNALRADGEVVLERLIQMVRGER